MSAVKAQCFIVEFPLKTTAFQEHILERRLNICRKLYNSLVTVTQKRYHEMVKTKEYRSLINAIGNDKKANASIYAKIRALRKQYRLTEYHFHADVKDMQHHFSMHIDAFTAQKVATALWNAYEKQFFGNGKQVHYKKYGSVNSMEGKSNASGIRFKDEKLMWNGLTIPVLIDYNNPYEVEAMTHSIAYCRIVRKQIKSKYRYNLQLVLRGVPPVKIDPSTGAVKHSIGSGTVGIDIGTSTIAVVGESGVLL